MNTATVPQSTDEEKARAWASEVRDLHARATAPVGVDDPRRAEIARVTRRPLAYQAQFEPETLAMFYWTKVTQLPPFPLDGPSWAVSTTIDVSEYPEIAIDFQGQQRTTVDADGTEHRAYLQQYATVFAEDVIEEGVSHHAGEIMLHGEPVIFAELTHDAMSYSTAIQLSVLLADAARELRSVVGAAE